MGALNKEYVYYDPVFDLPEAGQQYWREKAAQGVQLTHSVHA